MEPKELEKYSFLWSEIRLIIAAIALFLGGIPPIYKIMPYDAFGGLVGILLKLCWIISGATALYLLYKWNKSGQKLFNEKDPKDLITFIVLIVSGVNLGIAGLLGNNIGMSMIPYDSRSLIFIIVGAIYLFAAYNLFIKWQKNSNKLF
ncbi:MAG: hypothetical protein Q8L47_03280 [bacterium]|nr:hypothetical protein [bacterium]